MMHVNAKESYCQSFVVVMIQGTVDDLTYMLGDQESFSNLSLLARCSFREHRLINRY